MTRNITLVVAAFSLAVVGYISFSGEPVEPVVIDGIEIQIEDDGVSPVEIVPVFINGAIFLPETRYTYNDLLSEIEIQKRRGDDDYRKVEALSGRVHEELLLLPERTFPTIEEVFGTTSSSTPDFGEGEQPVE